MTASVFSASGEIEEARISKLIDGTSQRADAILLRHVSDAQKNEACPAAAQLGDPCLKGRLVAALGALWLNRNLEEVVSANRIVQEVCALWSLLPGYKAMADPKNPAGATVNGAYDLHLDAGILLSRIRSRQKSPRQRKRA